jgi:phage-related tail protein
VSKSFAQLGLQLPKTRDDFRHVVESIDLSTEAGQTLYGQLMKLTPAFSDLIDAQQAYYDKLKSLGNDFKQWLDNQLLGTSSTLTPQEKLLESQKQFSGAVDAARGGDTDAAAKITQYADQLLSVGRDFYASSAQYTALVEMTRKTVENLGKQLSLPGFAVGTANAPAGTAWVGEQGPELVRMHGGEQVYTAPQSAQMQENGQTDVVRAITLSNADQVAQLKEVATQLEQLRAVTDRLYRETRTQNEQKRKA